MKDGDESTAERDAIEREMVLGRGAIQMVAEGHYPSMTVGSLHHGREVLDALAPEASRLGVVLVALDRPDGGGPDIRAEQAEPRDRSAR